MPLTPPTVVGTTLNATIVDGNFELLRKYLQEQVEGQDISDGDITRYIIREFSGGRIKGVTTMEEPILDHYMATSVQPKSYHEVTYRAHAGIGLVPQSNHSMELLGRPGPSLYWQFQEDGITYGNAPDPNRYDKSLCYSLWLTVPGTSLKVYVPDRCVVRMHGRAYFLGSLAASGEYVKAVGGYGTWRTPPFDQGFDISMRLGLFVDTNPILWADEFPNSNPNILNPATGAQATHKSWSEVTSRTVYAPIWQREDITGEQILKGGRWYNFSVKYRGAGALGYRDGGVDPFIDNIYEYAKAGLPNFAGLHQSMIGTPPFEIQWVSTGLNLEFIYGYGSITNDTSTIVTVPS